MTLTASPTIAQELEARRLEHRAARLLRAIEALEDRRVFRQQTAGESPAALRAALSGFQEELADVRRRLAALPAT